MKVLFIDHTHPILIELFEANQWTCIDGSSWTLNEIEQNLCSFDGIIIRSRFVLTKETLQKGQHLKFIGRPGAGLENIDTEFCQQNNIKVFRSPEGNSNAVAEHTIGMLLALFRNIPNANTEVKQGKWDRISNRGEELEGKTIGIIGYGYMGKAFANILKGFNVNIIAYDKYKTSFSDNWVKEVTLNELHEQTDIFSIHTPLTKETIGMYNHKFLNKFKKDIYLINTARGQSLVLKDLVNLLKNKKIKGACLDVLEVEKTTFESVFEDHKTDEIDYLSSVENVILTPHIAGWTHQSNEKMSRFLGEKIINYFNTSI